MRIGTCALCCALSGAAAAQTVHNIGALPGGLFSWPTAVTDDGVVVLATSDSIISMTASRARACRWSAGQGLVDLGAVSAPEAQVYATAMSASGVIVSSVEILDTWRALRWTSAGGYTLLPMPPSTLRSYTNAMSADGSTLVGWVVAFGNQRLAARWTAGGPQLLGALPGHDFSSAEGVNGDGTVIVGASARVISSTYEWRAFRWTPGAGMLSLGIPTGWVSSEARIVSRAGNVIAGVVSTDPGAPGQAFVWTASGGFELLGILPGETFSEPRAMNADGSVVIGQSYTLAVNQAQPFIWTRATGIKRLTDHLASLGFDVSSWTPLDVRAMTPDGRTIVGQGDFPLKTPHDQGFVATIWPDPACYANRDGSTAPPILNIQDFAAFIAQVAAGSPQANCDGSLLPPLITVADFTCFINKFWAGCP